MHDTEEKPHLTLGEIVDERGGVEAYQATEAIEVAQVGDRLQLAQADRILRDRIRDRLMRDGVTLLDPPSIYVDARAQVDSDTVLLPGTHLLGETRVGRGCRIGPNAVLRDMVIGEGCTIGDRKSTRLNSSHT
mgnify:CR=1 FL=1